MLTLAVISHAPTRDAYALHRDVAAATTGERPLWAAPAQDLLVVQAETIVWERIRGAREARLRQVVTRYPAGAAVRFSLIASPTRGIGKRRPDGTLSIDPGRKPLPEDEQPAWLARKLSGALQLQQTVVSRLPAATGAKPGGLRITLTRRMFTGQATVTDPDALEALIRSGVGPGKAFGCGLLAVREAA